MAASTNSSLPDIYLLHRFAKDQLVLQLEAVNITFMFT